MSTRPFLGTVSSFAEAYPNVRTLRVEAIEHGEVRNEWQRRNTYSETDLPSQIPCSNPHCKQGGFDLNTTFLFLTHDNKTQYETTLYCPGHEGSPKGRRKGDACFNYLEVKVEVIYKA